jgi:hypothetical protein
VFINVIADATSSGDGITPAIIITLVISIAGVIFASITAPLILAHRTERMHREDQLSDYQRQDAVAKTAAETARALAEQQAEIIRQQKESNEATQRERAISGTKLDDIASQTKRIHTLVNSDMTAARQEELEQAESLIVVLQRVMALAKNNGLLPEQSDIDTLNRTKARRDELELILADRLAQFHASEAEAMGTPAGRKMLAEDDPKARP